MEKKRFKIDERDIVQNGLLVAMYVALTILLAPISFNAIQFNIIFFLLRKRQSFFAAISATQNVDFKF